MTIIEQVIDTRERDHDHKPIPGTGDRRPCDCCGKEHEVHVYITRTGIGSMIIGTSCMRKLRKTDMVLSRANRFDRIRHGSGYVTQSNLIRV